MVSVSFLKKKVEELRKEAEEIQKAGIKVLGAAALDEKTLLRPDFRTTKGKLQRETVQVYQRWYTTSCRLVKEFVPEWLDAFEDCYAASSNKRGGTNAVMDYLLLDAYTHFTTIEDIIADFVNDLDRQISILLCIPDAVEIKELNLRKLISADVARTEIEQAEILFAGGFHRASGSIAGVALELHLKTL